MHSISIRARSVIRTASLFAACLSVAAALAPAPSPARADALPHVTTTRVAVTNVGVCPPDALASLAQEVSVDKPEIAREERAYGTTTLRVDLSSQGKLLNTSVMTSTLNSLLDHAALAIIRQARFQPETRDCRHVAGSYLVDVVFPED